MPITARRNSDDAVNPQIHDGADQHITRTHPQVKPPSSVGVLSIILRTIIMCVLTSLFFLCVALATILLIHVFLAGRQLRRRRRRRRRTTSRLNHNPNAFSREDLSQLDEFKYCRRHLDDELDLDQDCVICLERFSDGVRYRILPGCGHLFHSNCIDKWLVKTPVCPICRASVRLK